MLPPDVSDPELRKRKAKNYETDWRTYSAIRGG
jgi:hypothetical protein